MKVIRYVLGAEIFAFDDAIDKAPLLCQEMKIMLDKKVPLKAVTDSSSLSKTFIRHTMTTKRSLMIKIEEEKEPFDRRDIDEIEWIDDNRNIADWPTKPAQCDFMEDFLHNHRFDYETL